MKLLIRSLLFCIIFFVGCAQTQVNWHPKQMPPIDLSIVTPYQENLSVDLINDQPDTTPQEYTSDLAMGSAKFVANYNEWTQFFVDNYTSELVKRGVKVSKDSTNKIKVKLCNFGYIQGWAKLRAKIEVQLSSDDGKWSKTYIETDTSGWSAGRAFGSVIYHTIEKLLRDQEVMDRMRIGEVK